MSSSQSRAFEFLYGHWAVHNRKLRNVADPMCDEWVKFDATSEVFPILDGIGHVDRIHVSLPSDGDPFEGFTLRLYDPSTDAWSIWWSSTRSPANSILPSSDALSTIKGPLSVTTWSAGTLSRFAFCGAPTSLCRRGVNSFPTTEVLRGS